jgi:signal transduction histidine kinase
MEDISTFRVRKSDPRLFVISGIVLAICLYYSYVYAFKAPITGITWNTKWQIIDRKPCINDIVSCEANKDNIQDGDQFRLIGDYTVEELDRDRRLVPFSGFEVGDTVPVMITRDSEQVETTWLMPRHSVINQIEFLITPLLIYGPFWLMGSFILLFMKPRDERWRILIVFSFTTALWIAVGLPSVSRVSISSLFLHALSWILIPVYLHLHLLVPTPLGKRNRYLLISVLYIFTMILATAELIQVLPLSSYLLAILVAGLGSIILLGYRSFILQPSADRLASRLMLTGVTLALGPGFILHIVPTLLGIGAGQIAIVLSIIAIPILPLFYTYAIYKHQLGIQEPRINRLLASYGLFLVYLTVLGVSFLIASSWLLPANELLAFGLIAALALLLTTLPLRDLAIKNFDRLAYGTRYNKEEILEYYAGRIPTVSNRKELLQLLTKDLLPSLNIHQSALLRLNHEEINLFYQVGVNLKQSNFTPKVVQILSEIANRYRPKHGSRLESYLSGLDWVRLAVPLRARADVIGLWLFGNRDPDDYYSKDDIDLLNTLARQLAITMENARLFVAFQKELANKERAEQNLARYAERLRLLHILDQAILAADSKEEIARVALDGIRELVPCIRTSIVLFDHDNQKAEILAVYRASNESSPIPFQMPINLFLDTIESLNDRIWNINELQRRVGRSPVIDELLSDGVRTVLNVPLIVANMPIGTLNVASGLDDAFSAEHIEIAREVANSVAVAIHNARLRSIISRHGRDLQHLSSRLIRVQEDERKRISYELHDEIGQVLTAVSFNLAAIEKECEDNPSIGVAEKLADTKSLVDHLTTQVRSLSLELRPTMLQDLGLIPTVRWYVNTFTERRGITVHLDTSNMNDRYPEDVETTLYRIVQEALTNVSRHAEASQVILCIERRDSIIRASIFDDGIGFQPEKILSSANIGKGVGLVAIRERVMALNGQFSIESAPGEGTHLEVEIPIGDGE